MDKIFVYYGIDHKCGTSMVCQSIAERIAKEFPQLKVLLIHTEGRCGTDFVSGVSESMERIRPYLCEGVLDAEEILSKSKLKENLYFIAGEEQLDSARLYQPSMSDLLLSSMRAKFDLIFCDSGSEIEHGLALGSLFAADAIYLVMVQSESALRRFEWLYPLYSKLSVKTAGYLINKYDKENPYSKKYMKQRLGLKEHSFLTIRESLQGAQAEIQRCTLNCYNEKPYSSDIKCMANCVLKRAGLPGIPERKKLI
ncbi:MAG: hypothetical protein EOM59_00445 [Clostridia bacterium]|nr:hypothetical protein [Clostridia bacterium]